ncbi:Uncharacterised protein [Bordetella pertussis]|nr:Uncharacterised protein [Bordetella pertussis]
MTASTSGATSLGTRVASSGVRSSGRRVRISLRRRTSGRRAQFTPHQTSKATSASMRVSRKTSWRCALASASTRLPMLSATTTNTWRCWLR